MTPSPSRKAGKNEASETSPELALKIWKQRKLIDYLEESEEIDVGALCSAYAALGSLHSEAGDGAAAEEALQQASALSGGPSGHAIDAAAAHTAGSSSSSSLLDFRTELKSAAGRPRSARVQSAVSGSRIVGRIDDLADAAVSAVDAALLPLLLPLQAAALADRRAAEAAIAAGLQKVQLQVATQLETWLRGEDPEKSSIAQGNDQDAAKSTPTSHTTAFVYWHADVLASTQALLERQMADTKRSLQEQVERERTAWLGMAQRQLDLVQAQYGSGEAVLQVEVLVEKYHLADNDILRWELSQLSALQSSQAHLLQLWHTKAAAQLEKETVMQSMQRKSLEVAGGYGQQSLAGSPQQRKQLQMLQRQLLEPSSLNEQNNADVKMLQRQIDEWRKVAMKNIEFEAEAELGRWRAEIDVQLSPRAKIAMIDNIEKQRTLKAVAFLDSAAGIVESEDGLAISSAAASRSPQAEAGGVPDSAGSPAFKSPTSSLTAGKEAAALTPLNLLGVSATGTNAHNSPHKASPSGKQAQVQGRGDGEEDDGESAPISPKGDFSVAAHGSSYMPPLSAQEAERAVQAELMQLQREKQLEIDLSIQEQRRYLQVVVQQQQMEREEKEKKEKKEEEERVKREAEAAEQHKLDREEEGRRALEAEWARLQAVMARDKADKQDRLRLEQERAEAKFGVRVKSSVALLEGNASSSISSGDDETQRAGKKKKVGKKLSKSPKKPLAAGAPSLPTKSPALGSSVALHSTNQQELAYASHLSRAAGGANVSVLAGLGMGAGAGAAIFASALSKEEKLQQLKQLAEERDKILSQGTAIAYSMTDSGEMITAGGSMLINPLDSAVNPLQPPVLQAKHRYQHGSATAFETALDPVVKFSRNDRAVPLTGATPKGPGAGEAARVKAVRDSANLLAMLADAKQRHLEEVAFIYTEEQPKLVLGQRHGDTASSAGGKGASAGGGRPGSTNAYRAFTPDDRSLRGIQLIRDTASDEFEDDGFDGMKLSMPDISPRSTAAQSTRYDGRPDVSYIHPPDIRASTPSGTAMIVRTGQYMLDRKLPASPGPLSPNTSLYGNGGMSGMAYPHIAGNDGTVGRVTETEAANFQKEKGFGVGNTSSSTSNSLVNHHTDIKISQDIEEELQDIQSQRVSKMPAQEKLDFAAYHGQQLQVLGTLGSGLDANSVLSTDDMTHAGIMKALPNFVSRPIKHLTATGSTSLGITAPPRTASPNTHNTGAIGENVSLLDQSPFASVKAPAAHFKCPHPGCQKSFPVAFELFNHANRSHLGVVGDLARDPSNLQDYYFQHGKPPQGGALAAVRSEHPTKVLSHANSPAYRNLDPFRATAQPQQLGTKAFVKKIRIPADQVIDRGQRAKGKTGQPTGGNRAVTVYNNTTNGGTSASPNKNTHFDRNLMSPTLGSPSEREARAGAYSSSSGGQSTNTFVMNSYQAMSDAKARFLARQQFAAQQEALPPPAGGGNYGTHVPLGHFNPAVVSLSRKWEEQQQMQVWNDHTKLLKDWRRTYERQLSLEAKTLPTGALATRTREKFVPKAGVM